MSAYEGLRKGTIKTGKIEFRQFFLFFLGKEALLRLSDGLPGQHYTIYERMFPFSHGVWKNRKCRLQDCFIIRLVMNTSGMDSRSVINPAIKQANSVMPDLIRHPVPAWIPAFAGMTTLRYLVAGVIVLSNIQIVK